MKMLALIFFIIAAFITGSSGSWMSIDCYLIYEKVCPDDDLYMPKNAEDLQNLCKQHVRGGYCFLEVMEKCATDKLTPSDTMERVEEFRTQLEYLESVCDEDSIVFKAIASNLNCIASTVKNMDKICLWEDDLNITTHEAPYNIFGIDFKGYDNCFVDFWMHYCLKARLELNPECENEDILHASTLILENYWMMPSCKNALNEYQYFEDAFKKEFRQGKRGHDIIPGLVESIAKELD